LGLQCTPQARRWRQCQSCPGKWCGICAATHYFVQCHPARVAGPNHDPMFATHFRRYSTGTTAKADTRGRFWSYRSPHVMYKGVEEIDSLGSETRSAHQQCLMHSIDTAIAPREQNWSWQAVLPPATRQITSSTFLDGAAAHLWSGDRL